MLQQTVRRTVDVVKIRLQRIGKANRPHYRIVAQDARSRRDSPALEILGTYDPLKKSDMVQVDAEKLRSWLSKGAQPTEKLAVILKQAGVSLS